MTGWERIRGGLDNTIKLSSNFKVAVKRFQQSNFSITSLNRISAIAYSGFICCQSFFGFVEFNMESSYFLIENSVRSNLYRFLIRLESFWVMSESVEGAAFANIGWNEFMSLTAHLCPFERGATW